MNQRARTAPFSFKWTAENRSFETALALLAHPVSLGALGVLLLNDHVLRRFWPSWWTGKLGDAAWLIFAPLALAALLAWVLLPLREPRRQRWTIGLGVAGVGLSFLLLKLFPDLLSIATRIPALFFHTSLAIVADPSDLLTLPALAVPCWLWRKAQAIPPATLRGWNPQLGWGALPLAALLTLANSGMPDYGITCLLTMDGQLRASSNYGIFLSSDGGITWQETQLPSGPNCQPQLPQAQEQPWLEAAGPRAGQVFRFYPGREILLSIDSRQSWHAVYPAPVVSEAKRFYFLKSRQGYAGFQPGPLDALADPASGNMVFAMGHQGLLVYTAAGQWVWSPAGTYQPLTTFPTTDSFVLLLGGMLYLAGALALLTYSSLALRWAGGTIRIVLLILGWLGWLAVDILFPPAQSWGYNQAISGMGITLVLVWVLILAGEQTFRLARRTPRRLPALAGLSLLGGLLYFLPYVLWLFSTLPGLGWATTFGIACALCVLIAALLTVRRWPGAGPSVPKAPLVPPHE